MYDMNMQKPAHLGISLGKRLRRNETKWKTVGTKRKTPEANFGVVKSGRTQQSWNVHSSNNRRSKLRRKLCLELLKQTTCVYNPWCICAQPQREVSAVDKCKDSRVASAFWLEAGCARKERTPSLWGERSAVSVPQVLFGVRWSDQGCGCAAKNDRKLYDCILDPGIGFKCPMISTP